MAKVKIISNEEIETYYYVIFEKKQYKLCSAPLCVAIDKSRFDNIDVLEKHYIKISNKYKSKFIMNKRRI